MKTYHMYHAESISAESKLKEAEKQEEKQFNKSGDISVNLLRHEDRPQRRSSVKKIEKMKEKVGGRNNEPPAWLTARLLMGAVVDASYMCTGLDVQTKISLWQRFRLQHSSLCCNPFCSL